jgi:tripartite ATP-independent transporter DctP family solute receptor
MLRAAGASAVLAACSPHLVGSARAQAAVKRIRFAHPAPTAHGWHIWAEQFKKTIEEKSGGKIQVQIFPNAQMGNERDTAQAVRLGSIEMGAIGVGLMNWVPEMSITDAPFLWKSRAQCWNAITGAFGDDLRKRSLEKGFVLSGWTDLGFRAMTNNKLPINAVKDMQNLKMRVPNSKAYIAMMQATGASTVAVDLSELYLALRQGVADGQDTPSPVVKSNKYYEVQKYISKTDHILTTAYTVTNPKFYDGLSADEQKVFWVSCKDADNHLRQYTTKDELEVFDFLKAQGMQVNLNPDLESFRAACAPVVEKYPDLFLPELVKMARATPA